MIHRLRRLVRAVIVGFGFVLMLLGLVGAFLPTHLAGFLLVLGLILVLRNSIRWRRRFIIMQRRYPRYGYPLRRLLRGEVWPVIWHELQRHAPTAQAVEAAGNEHPLAAQQLVPDHRPHLAAQQPAQGVAVAGIAALHDDEAPAPADGVPQHQDQAQHQQEPRQVGREERPNQSDRHQHEAEADDDGAHQAA
jgi:hypothetical protein